MKLKFERARGFHQAGSLAAAEEIYRDILKDNPGAVEVLYWMGILQFQKKDLTAAEECLQRTIRLLPENASFHYSLGVVQSAAGNLEQAVSSFKNSLRINPEFAAAYNNLGVAYAALGETDNAVNAYSRAIQFNPEDLSPRINIGVAYYEQGEGDLAVDAFRQVLERESGNMQATQYLGNAYYEQGHFDEALDCYRKVSLTTNSAGAKIRTATALPMIMQSEKQVHEIRTRVQESVADLCNKSIRIGDPVNEIGYTNFLLAYHGKNDRDLQQQIANFYLSVCPMLSYVAPHCENYRPPAAGKRIRIGFISRFLKNHSIGKTSRGIIEYLSKDEFEVVVIFLDKPVDNTSQIIAAAADSVVLLPSDLQQAQARLAKEELDILFYQDTGMDAFTFFLAFSRLAPAQCTSFGHPVTTGIPNIDYYISTDYWEPEGGQKHYSEKLVRLRDVASVAYYYKPALPETLRPRAYFGLSDEEHVYICPQTLFKIHPDFDVILEGILAQDPVGRVVMLDGKHRHWSVLLGERFQTTIPDVAGRISFLPQQKGNDFINLLAVSDVMLDTPHFCGFNTSLEGFSVGVPVVTLPGEFMRSRHTMSFYKKMQFMDCVAKDADDYIRIALKLGLDSGYRKQVSRKIVEKQGCLWEEVRVVREFEVAFREMMADM